MKKNLLHLIVVSFSSIVEKYANKKAIKIMNRCFLNTFDVSHSTQALFEKAITIPKFFGSLIASECEIHYILTKIKILKTITYNSTFGIFETT